MEEEEEKTEKEGRSRRNLKVRSEGEPVKSLSTDLLEVIIDRHSEEGNLMERKHQNISKRERKR